MTLVLAFWIRAGVYVGLDTIVCYMGWAYSWAVLMILTFDFAVGGFEVS